MWVGEGGWGGGYEFMQEYNGSYGAGAPDGLLVRGHCQFQPVAAMPHDSSVQVRVLRLPASCLLTVCDLSPVCHASKYRARRSPDSLAQGVKYVFQTSQASQIANLMTRYCEMAKSTGALKK